MFPVPNQYLYRALTRQALFHAFNPMLYGQVAQSNSSVRTNFKRIAKRERDIDMALEDFLEPEVAVTAAVTAAVFSPRARKIIRRGLVYGVAGVLIAGDALASVARNVSQGVQQAGAAAVNTAQQTMNQAKTEASAAEPATSTATHRRTTQTKTPSDTMGG